MPQCLIVDDLPVIRRVARVIIEDFGFEVREAEHGRQAFEMCAIRMPEVIMLDWQMPLMGAYEFLRALRSFGPRQWPYIIYCTTESNFVDMQRARAAGAADVLLKPFDRSMLKARIDRYVHLGAAGTAPAEAAAPAPAAVTPVRA